MEDTLVIPLSPPNKREFLYNHERRHNSLDVKEMSLKTREIRTLCDPMSAPRIPSTLKSGDVARSTPARRCPVQPIRRWYDERGKAGCLTTADVYGAQPMHLHAARRNKPDFCMNITDIPGAFPQPHSTLSKRQVNPMAPMYVLPSSVAAPPIVLPLARPANFVEDIDGAQPNVKYMRWKQRTSTFLVDDVEGSSPTKRRLYKDRRSPMDVSDIINDPEGAGHEFRTNRRTNVMDPRYVWDVPSGYEGQWLVGDIGGDKPASLCNARDAPRCLHGKQMPPKEFCKGSLSKTLHELQLGKAVSGFEYLSQPRQEVRNTNHIADIVGANADSVRPGMTTKRVTDPLKPNYVWPGLSADIGNAAFCHTPDRVPTPVLVEPSAAPEQVRDKAHAELEDSLQKVKEVFHQRGAYAGRALARVVRNFDDGDGHINKEELGHGLRSYLGFEMDNQDFDYVWNYFDTDGSGEIDVSEFLHGIRGNLNKHRLKMVVEAFEKIDRDTTGQISLNEIEALYDVSHHPKVTTGEWSRKDALRDFLHQWDADENGEVSKDEFVDYFKDVSLGIGGNEEFSQVMRDIFPTLAPPEIVFRSSPNSASRPPRSSAGNTPDSSALHPGRLARARSRSSSQASAQKAQYSEQEVQSDMAAVRDIRTPASAAKPMYRM